jgi:hypothetical protein
VSWSKGRKSDDDIINGHELERNDKELQYACIFELPDETARECAEVDAGVSCDCRDPGNTNPLCEDGVGGRTRQVSAKAYPVLRQLQILKGLGKQGIVGSICPEQCPAAEKRMVRFVGKGESNLGSTLFISCAGE